MIDRKDLAAWKAIDNPRWAGQAVIDAGELIEKKGFTLDPSIPFDEFSRAVTDLINLMPGRVSLGWDQRVRTTLMSKALNVFDPDSMQDHAESFAELFKKCEGELREQRDTGKSELEGLPWLTSALKKSMHLMPVSSYRWFFGNAVGYAYLDTSSVDRRMFNDAEVAFASHPKLITDPAFKALIDHGFEQGISKADLQGKACIKECIAVSMVLCQMRDAGLEARLWQLDLLQATHLLSHLAKAHGEAAIDSEKALIASGAEALMDVFFRPASEKPLMRSNCFRPYEYPTYWAIWLDPEPMKQLTEMIVEAMDSIDKKGDPRIAGAVERLTMRLLIDGTICAQALAPTEAKMSAKAARLKAECAAHMGNFVRALVARSEDYMAKPKAMNGLNLTAKSVLIGLLPDGEVKTSLLRAHKRARGQVLMDDLGM